ncbi:NBS-LRR type resistance protein [Cucumis melo var. makuwa]|uniref:NBS-LRR type resistance protein n=1 Tax=Cucumis melo var. makuwa TaxID=1194695 RepID=A0A5D3DT96_CUCMM|nr:NBS-LRR type resistance protein [Cucumis melo var. makuwa]
MKQNDTNYDNMAYRQSDGNEGYMYQFSDLIGCTYQSSNPVGCTYQSSDLEGCTTYGDPVGHYAYKVNYPIDKANSFTLVHSKPFKTVTSKHN